MKTTRWLLSSLLALTLGTAATAAVAGAPEAAPVSDAKGKTGISWKVGPENVEIWLDGKKLGSAGTLTFTETKPGKHTVRLTKGGDETEMEVKVAKGEVLKFEFEFTE
ncbi:PEGA domain-containing protein [Myxococcota bacterium]|nr:PEGA domain-containing protein [Myxococcota bacterium]